MKKTPSESLRATNRPFQSAAGFSLIELLITLAIIAILFSIMMPTFSIVRQSAEKLMCMNNLRAIHYGINGYSNINRRRFPLSQHAEQRRYQQTMAMSVISNPLVDNAQEWDGLVVFMTAGIWMIASVYFALRIMGYIHMRIMKGIL